MSRPRIGLLTSLDTLFLTAMMLAHKFLDDPAISNRQWALTGELSVKEMNSHELRMLWDFKFSPRISRAKYNECAMRRRSSCTPPYLRDTSSEEVVDLSHEGGLHDARTALLVWGK